MAEHVERNDQEVEGSLLEQIFLKTLEEKSVAELFSDNAFELLAEWTHSEKLDGQQLSTILQMMEEKNEAPAD